MLWLPAIFSLLVGAAGWFYMFYSQAASNLAPLEEQPINTMRIRLRRLGGLAMILLAVSFYLGFAAMEHDHSSTAAFCMLLVFILLGIIIVLGFVDLRLTNRIRRSKRRQDDP